jgi:formaldehyde-activating enzyme
MPGSLFIAFLMAKAVAFGDQAKGHSKVFAILNTDIQVRPVTLMVSKVTVNNSRYTNILMGTVQAAIANGVLDAVRASMPGSLFIAFLMAKAVALR